MPQSAAATNTSFGSGGGAGAGCGSIGMASKSQCGSTTLTVGLALATVLDAEGPPSRSSDGAAPSFAPSAVDGGSPLPSRPTMFRNSCRVPCEGVEMLPTFIKTKSQRTFYLVNNSSDVVHFSWRNLATEIEEFERRAMDDADAAELEREALRFVEDADALDEERASQDGDESEYTGSESEGGLDVHDAVAHAHTLRLHRQKIASDRQLFADELYAIYPLEGSIWPNTELELTVRFGPLNSGEVPSTAFCDVSGRGERLPLSLKGKGVGPKAIAPGESETFEVIFAAENDRSYAEILGINVADRDPADSPGGMPYEIMGDSCVPGVNCTDVNSIFEEHRIVQALDPFNPMERVYAMREKAFSFGPTIAVTNKADSGEGDDQGGLVANLKISNTQKVNCTVNFSVSPKMDDPPAEFPITVTPASWEIPPQETRYVTLRFLPTTIQSYVGLFEAVVDNRADPRTKSFTCEVHGEGTLPTITIEQPTEFTEDGALALSFPRLLQGKKVTRSIHLKNNGIVPATFRMNMRPNKDFSLGENGVPITLEPKRAHIVPVEFSPAALGDYTADVKMLVQYNRYETQRLVLNATCYTELVTFEDLPDGYDDELHFSDGPVGKRREVGFVLRNNASTPVRFEFPAEGGADTMGDVTFVPRVGHIKAGATKAITAVFAPIEDAVTHDGVEVAIQLAQIKYTAVEIADAVADWDDRPRRVTYAGTEDGGDGNIYLRGRETTTINLTYRPSGRMRPFDEEIPVTVQGVEMTLFSVRGACIGTELKLNAESLNFGHVVLGSQLTKRLSIENTGDVDAKFSWDLAALGPHFSLTPAEGFLGAGQEVKIDVVFHPDASISGSDARAERVTCHVEGGGEMRVTLSGSCTTAEPLEEVVSFSTPVRGTDTKSITLQNDTQTAWQLKPVITNDFWKGSELLQVAADGSATYELTFQPTAMTREGGMHEGSVFFPLPDGSGRLYRLQGTAGEPPSSGSVSKELVSKEDHTEILSVANWLPRAQRFLAKIEMLSEVDEAFSLTGPPALDVPAHSERVYRLHALMHREGTMSARVTFLNEKTGEYMWYEVSFTAGPPSSRGTVQLEGAVRQRITRMVRVANPLSKDVTLKTSCDNARVRVADAAGSVVVKAGESSDVELVYRPLVVGKEDAKLTLSCDELGVFEWDLVLSGTMAGMERALTFNVPLGQRAVSYFRFNHFLDEKATYSCQFETGNDFESEAEVTAVVAQLEDATMAQRYEQAVEQEVEIAFEPTRLGENFRDVLTVSHPTAGTFVCPVSGRCVPPKPQGPVEIKGGAGTFKFKNVFPAEAVFTFVCDNPCFVVDRTQTLAAKRTIDVAVKYTAQEGKASDAKLIVSCEAQTTATWVFYLKA